MARFNSAPFAFPEFRGTARRLILWNLCAYFALALGQLVWSPSLTPLKDLFGFLPHAFLNGALWQPITYSLVHPTELVMGTAFELLSLWFIAGFLENYHDSGWVLSLYVFSVLGTAAAATALYAASPMLGYHLAAAPLYGCFGGIFGLLVVIGAIHGDVEFLLFFVVSIKARYLVAIYALVSIAMLFFSQQRMYAFAQLGGALVGLIYMRVAPRRGISFSVSERWYALRNRYYRWKRRRAARHFEVYMRSQGRTIRFDKNGRPINEDVDDKSHWN